MKILIASLLGVVILSAQPSAKVQGTVTNTLTHEPMNEVMVTLHFSGGPKTKGNSYATETKGGGHFTFLHVGPGKYVITVQRDGFRREPDASPGVPSPPVVVEDGKDLTLAIKMEPLSVISGKIKDPDGDPIRNVSVMAMRYGYVAGKKQLNSAGSVVSDDRGEYRLFGLVPGKYYIRAAHNRNGPIVQLLAVNAPTFFPGTTDPVEAAAIIVGPGSEAAGIDITLRSEAVFKVRGSMPSLTRDQPPQPAKGPNGAFYTTNGVQRMGRPNYSLRLIPTVPESLLMGYPLSMSEQNGLAIFEFSDVPAGSYILTATRSLEDGHTLYARENVQVAGSNVEGVSLTFVPAFDVTGKVVFQGPATGKFETMRVRLAPPTAGRGGAVPLVPLKEDGTFVMHDVPPEVFEATVNSPEATYLKSVQVGTKVLSGREVDFTRGPVTLTLVLASDFGEVKGAVKDEKGEPVPRVRVTAIPIGDDLGRMDISRFAFTNEKGAYTIERLPPGDYKMFAWDKVDTGAPQDPDFRKPYEKQGKEIHLKSAGHETADLTVVRVVEP